MALVFSVLAPSEHGGSGSAVQLLEEGKYTKALKLYQVVNNQKLSIRRHLESRPQGKSDREGERLGSPGWENYQMFRATETAVDNGYLDAV